MENGYLIPVFIIGILLLPLVFVLLFGRVFCSSICPLGALQDVVLIRGLRIPRWIENALGLFAFLYLGVAVFMAAAGGQFLICRYDPFVALFRFSGTHNMLIFGGVLLLLCTVFGRTYCRFICPLGAVFRALGPLAKKQVTTTPDECIKCRLCEKACPFNAIEAPNDDQPLNRPAGKIRLAVLLVLLPVVVAGGALLGNKVYPRAAGAVNKKVFLGIRLLYEDEGRIEKNSSDETIAFRQTGRDINEAVREAQDILEQYSFGGWFLGGWITGVIWLKLISLSVKRTRTGYQPNPSSCVGCGRCWAYCPIEKRKRKQRLETS